MMAEIVPAILTDSVDDLRKKLQILEQFAKSVHIDILDGQYVPSRSISLADLATAPTTLAVELHLLVREPHTLLTDCLAVHPHHVIIHPDADSHPENCFRLLREAGVESALGLHEATLTFPWQSFLQQCDQITFVEVCPGFQGGAYKETVIAAAETARRQYPNMVIELDGGVNDSTLAAFLKRVRPQRLIAGSVIWNAADPKAAYEELKNRSESIPYGGSSSLTHSLTSSR